MKQRGCRAGFIINVHDQPDGYAHLLVEANKLAGDDSVQIIEAYGAERHDAIPTGGAHVTSSYDAVSTSKA